MSDPEEPREAGWGKSLPEVPREARGRPSLCCWNQDPPGYSSACCGGWWWCRAQKNDIRVLSSGDSQAHRGGETCSPKSMPSGRRDGDQEGCRHSGGRAAGLRGSTWQTSWRKMHFSWFLKDREVRICDSGGRLSRNGTVDATNIVLSCAGSVSLQFRKNDSE